MALTNTITFRQGAKANLPTTALTVGEPLFVTDDKQLFIATAGTTSVCIGGEIDADPTLGTSHIKLASQGAIKSYVDSASGGEGLSVKQSVVCASETNDDGANSGYDLGTTRLSVTAAAEGAISAATTGTFDTFANGSGAAAKPTIEPEIGDVISFSGGTGGGSGYTVTAITAHDEGLPTPSWTLTISGAVTIADNVAVTFTSPIGVGQTLTDGAVGVVTIDGIPLTLGDRFLLKDQSAAEENGLWKVTTAGAVDVVMVATRTDDFNIGTAVGAYQGEINVNAFVFCGGGTVHAETGWAVSTLGSSFSPGVSTNGDITWTQFTGVGNITAGDGLDKDANELSLDLKANGGLVIENTELAVDLAGSSITNTLVVGNGGTGATTLTDGGILLGSGTGALTVLGRGTHGQIAIGSTGADPVMSTITAGTNVGVANTAGTITISSSDQYTGTMTDVSDDTTPELGGDLIPGTNYIGMTLGTSLASATALVMTGAGSTGGLTGDFFRVTGTATITSMTVAANRHFFLEFAGALVLTHAGSDVLELPGAANITTVAGDVAEFFSTDANKVTCVNYTRVAQVYDSAFLTAASTATLTNKTFDANGTGNSLSNVDMANDVTGTLAVGNGGSGATSLTDGGILLGSGSGAITALAVLSDGQMIVGDGTTDPVAESGDTLRISIGVGSSSTFQCTGIELGAATDTTIARVSSGLISVEGDTVALLTAVQTLTNKTIVGGTF